jgi:hypothetical protein
MHILVALEREPPVRCYRPRCPGRPLAQAAATSSDWASQHCGGDERLMIVAHLASFAGNVAIAVGSEAW